MSRIGLLLILASIALLVSIISLIISIKVNGALGLMINRMILEKMENKEKMLERF